MKYHAGIKAINIFKAIKINNKLSTWCGVVFGVGWK